MSGPAQRSLDLEKGCVPTAGIIRTSLPFMERFNLGRLFFKTPAQNIGAIRVKENLRIRYLESEWQISARRGIP